ncbi:headcase protein-like [Teleopsis dalmanni]|uniref:headcase protein-like n=1 Tax=Teleopsis dalmanni TaxID=139649 RepID=UPI0018CD1C9B|nr:headcase protein-like [Teleopsis dalmanni]
MSPMQTTSSSVNTNNNFNNSNVNNKEQFLRCCYPSGDCLRLDSSISFGDPIECVRVICNNENCFVGQYMHRECFDAWEQSILATFKSIGRARCWSDRQRSQNLWTKKGYELINKSCVCKCGRGHIRKDLDWPLANVTKNIGNSLFTNGIANSNRLTNSVTNIENCNDDDEKKKKKKRNRSQKAVMALSTLNTNAYHTNGQQEHSGSYDDSSCVASVVGNGNAQNTSNINSSNVITNCNSNNLVTNPKVGVIGSGLNHNNNNQHQTFSHIHSQQNILASINNIINNNNCNGNILGIDLCTNSESITSTEESISPSTSQCSEDISVLPKCQQVHEQSLQQNVYSKTGINYADCAINFNNSSSASSTPVLIKQKSQEQSLLQLSPETHSLHGADLMQTNIVDQQQLVQQQKNKEVEIYSERVRSTSGCNGIFSRRLDFSSFNLLPKTRLNSYQVKMR